MDNTVVGTFADETVTGAVKKDLLDAGFSENEISVFIDTAAQSPDGLWATLKYKIHPDQKFRTYAVITVYSGLHGVDRAEEILRRHGAAEVHVHVERTSA